MTRIVWFFDLPDETTLPERLQGLFGKARDSLGFVPNVFRAYSYRPERLSAWFGHYKQLHEPTPGLDVADREMIAVVVSAWNRCTYCVVSHGHALRVALGGDAAAGITADHVAINWRHAGFDERRSAICAFAEKLTDRPHEMAEDDLAGLENHGLSKHEVWDVIEIVAMYNFTNRLALATGQRPNDEYHHLDRPGPPLAHTQAPGAH